MLANYPGQAYMEAPTTGAGVIHHIGSNLISHEVLESGLRKVETKELLYLQQKPTNFNFFMHILYSVQVHVL
jgi:hypothetical protein